MHTPEFKMVIGLGNPGTEYRTTHHNAGFLFIEALLGKTAKWKGRATFEFAKADKRLFVRPLLFMNQSGSAVKDALRYFKVRENELLLVHDDSDLLQGTYRLAFGSGAAGHHGIESIIRALGTKDFWRLRIGIRPREAARTKAGDFVLSKMNAREKKEISELAHFVSLKLKLNEMPEAVVDKLVSGNSTF